VILWVVKMQTQFKKTPYFEHPLYIEYANQPFQALTIPTDSDIVFYSTWLNAFGSTK